MSSVTPNYQNSIQNTEIYYPARIGELQNLLLTKKVDGWFSLVFCHYFQKAGEEFTEPKQIRNVLDQTLVKVLKNTLDTLSRQMMIEKKLITWGGTRKEASMNSLLCIHTLVELVNPPNIKDKLEFTKTIHQLTKNHLIEISKRNLPQNHICLPETIKKIQKDLSERGVEPFFCIIFCSYFEIAASELLIDGIDVNRLETLGNFIKGVLEEVHDSLSNPIINVPHRVTNSDFIKYSKIIFTYMFDSFNFNDDKANSYMEKLINKIALFLFSNAWKSINRSVVENNLI